MGRGNRPYSGDKRACGVTEKAEGKHVASARALGLAIAPEAAGEGRSKRRQKPGTLRKKLTKPRKATSIQQDFLKEGGSLSALTSEAQRGARHNKA